MIKRIIAASLFMALTSLALAFTSHAQATASGTSTSCTTYYYCAIKYNYDASGNRTQRYYQCSSECLGGSSGYSLRQAKPAGSGTQVSQPIVVFPNPSQGIFNIQLPANVAEAQAIVTDASGAVVLSQTIKGRSPTIDISKCTLGAYTIKIITENTTFTNKLIKQ
jgi:Secretion system C-terminal sorting domain